MFLQHQWQYLPGWLSGWILRVGCHLIAHLLATTEVLAMFLTLILE